MTAQVTSTGHFRLVLPGQWAHVPLGSEDVTTAFARRLVRERVGRDDRLARVRRDAVEQVTDAAAKAREAGAHTLAIALEIVPGVPFAASLLGRDVPWPDSSPSVDPNEDRKARLTSAFPNSEVVDLPAGPSARSLESGVLRGNEETTTSVSVTHRVPRPDADALLSLRFTGPDIGRPELIAQLFDAVAESVEFMRARTSGPERDTNEEKA